MSRTRTPVKACTRPLLVLLALLVASSRVNPEPLAPVVFVPGLLGSVLKSQDGEGEIVWGGSIGQMRARFGELELPPGGHDDLRAIDVLRSVQILGPFEAGQYGSFLDWLEREGFRLGETLFLFPYDWRLSNFENAKRLRERVEGEPKLRDTKFTIVAHSMGGLVSRIYLAEEGGGDRVRMLVTVGTPHLGSVSAIRAMLEGWGTKSLFLGGRDRVRRVMLSFPSLYELLPTYQNSCIDGRIGDQGNEAFDPLDINNVTRLGWLLPPFSDEPMHVQHVTDSLERRRRLKLIVAGPPPPDVEVRVVVGKTIDTVTQAFFDRTTHEPRYRDSPGDGTVYVRSGGNAPSGALDGTYAAIHKHSKMFDNAQVREQLKSFLVREEDIAPYSYASVTGHVKLRDGTTVPVEAVDLSMEDPVSGPGIARIVRLHVLSNAQTEARIAGFDATATLVTQSGKSMVLAMAEDEDGQYIATFAAPSDEGIHAVRAIVPGLGEFEELFVVTGSVP